MDSLSGQLPVSQYEASSHDVTNQSRKESKSGKRKPEYTHGHRSLSITPESVDVLTVNVTPDPGEKLPSLPLGAPARDRQVRRHFSPEVLAPRSKKLQSDEEMCRNADAFGELYEEITGLIRDYTRLFEQVSVSCIGLVYKVEPPDTLTCFKKLQGLIREYEKRLIESFPSIRARGVSDIKFQDVCKEWGLAEAFSQDVRLLKDFGGKQAIERCYWQGMRLSTSLIGFMCKRMKANFSFSENIHAMPNLMRPDFAPHLYVNWILDNLELLKTYYQVACASERLSDIDSAQIQSIYDDAILNGSVIMKEVCDLLKFTHRNRCDVDFFKLLTANDKVLIEWLDSLDLQDFGSASFARENSRRLFYTIIGYCLVGDLKQACLCLERMVKVLPFGAIEKGDIFLLVLHLTYLCDILFRHNTENLSKDLLRVSGFENLIIIAQRICEQANIIDKFGGQILPDDLHYDSVKLIQCMGDTVKAIRKSLEFEEKKINDAVMDLIHKEELEKKNELEARLKRQRKTVKKSGAPVKETGVKTPEVDATEIKVNEETEEFSLHPDICSAINLYLAKVPFHEVEHRLETLLAHGSQLEIALAQYALADMLRDKILSAVEHCESYLPTIEEFKNMIVQDTLPVLGLDFLFCEAMRVYARASEPVSRDLNHLQSIASQFNSRCSDEGELLHDIADKMIELHDQLADLTTRGEKVAEDCKLLDKLYTLRGGVLRKRGLTASKDTVRAIGLKDASNSLRTNSDQIERACSSLRALRSWEVCHRAQQILDVEAQSSLVFSGESSLNLPSTIIDNTMEAMPFRESLHPDGLESIGPSSQPVEISDVSTDETLSVKWGESGSIINLPSDHSGQGNAELEQVIASIDCQKMIPDLSVPDLPEFGAMADSTASGNEHGGMQESSDRHSLVSKKTIPQPVICVSEGVECESKEGLASGNTFGVFEKGKSDTATIVNLQKGDANVAQRFHELSLDLIPDLIKQQLVKMCKPEELKAFLDQIDDLKNLKTDLRFWHPASDAVEHPAKVLAEALKQPVLIVSRKESAVFYPANPAMNISGSIVRNAEEPPAFAVQINIEDDDHDPQYSDVDELDKPDSPIMFGHALPDSLVKASCHSFKEKGLRENLKAEEVSLAEKTTHVAGKGKKARQRQKQKNKKALVSNKAKEPVGTDVKPYELESKFNRYVKKFLEKGCLRSGKQLPPWFDVSLWFDRYNHRQIFSLDDIDAFSSLWSNAFESYDYKDLKFDLMVYAEALELTIKAELDHDEVFIFKPGMTVEKVQAGMSLHHPHIELVRVKREWFASHNHYWDSCA
ncbi:hypothetical protein [Endozoicomonas elysicola]|uniref:Uncharacterized protein n=1 Tax=Endozoicomonas elysicola TaxID=305900 RepID=A0A081KET6_9GAMM|nr:hypothetical protein [Endozoicomonas elysicola]KEI72662.1 hypothetical protein GV64_19725 [Endozoicomonas elysicola]